MNKIEELNNRLQISDAPLTTKNPYTITDGTKTLDSFEEGLQELKKFQALRYNEGKVQWSLVDFQSLEPMVRVLEYGAKKYARDNWKKGMPASQILESMLRHTFKLMNGEFVDEESMCEHVGHIQCNALFLAYVLKNKPEFNDLQQSKP